MKIGIGNRRAVLVLHLLVVACGDSGGGSVDAAVDGALDSATDGGGLDAAPFGDASDPETDGDVVPDAAEPDAAEPDAAEPDAAAPDAAEPRCGDGAVDMGEACDDGNEWDEDGCSGLCELEYGYICSGAPSVCDGECGDGIKAGSELCDDDNTNDDDGCSSLCEVESHYACTGWPLSVCGPDCGDGVIFGGEACDDTDEENGDGCSRHCELEEGFDCTDTAPTSCQPECGDGLVRGGEQCDDHNLIDDDGCSATCTFADVVASASHTDAIGLPDNAYNGTLASMTCVDVPVAGITWAIGSIRVRLAIAHTYIGDLVIKVVNPAGVVTTLMSRPGLAEVADDGQGDGQNTGGRAADLETAFPITFRNQAYFDAEAMGQGLSNSQVVCRDNGLCDYMPAAGSAAPGNLFDLNTGTLVGTWKVCLADANSEDVGYFTTVTMYFGR